MTMPLCVRWTIGDVVPFGVEALRLSIWGAYRCFGPSARYVVSVHGVSASRARALVGALPEVVGFHAVEPRALPAWLVRESAAPRAAARFAPPTLDDARAELAIDRGCVLWSVPPALQAWLDDPDPRACLLLEDEGALPTTALRGAGVGFDLGEALREAQRETPRTLRTAEELERLEIHAVGLLGPPHRVPHAQLGEEHARHGVRLRAPTDAASRARWVRARAELQARLSVPIGGVAWGAPPLA